MEKVIDLIIPGSVEHPLSIANSCIDHSMEEAANQREEILRAFISKYGYEPDQLEQVIQQGTKPGQIIWYVRKKGEQ